jgi:amino acid transporter
MAPFWSALLVSGVYFGSFMGLFMWAFALFAGSDPYPSVPIGAVIAGVVFGFSMASYYAIGRRKYSIPLWKDFHATAET